MSGKYSRNHSRRKGSQFERDVVNAFKEIGMEAKRTAPMQAGHAQDFGDVYVHGFGNIECKRTGYQYKTVYNQLGKNDALIIRPDNQEALIIMPLKKYLHEREDND